MSHLRLRALHRDAGEGLNTHGFSSTAGSPQFRSGARRGKRARSEHPSLEAAVEGIANIGEVLVYPPCFQDSLRSTQQS